MKKKTLLILLIIPFIIGLLSFVSVIVLNNTVATDILDILWDYPENEGFKIGSDYLLKAEAKVDPNLILASGNELTWRIKNSDEDDPVAKIIYKEDYGTYYFSPIKLGECKVICSNVRGTKEKSFNAIVYDKGAVLINPKNKGSEENIDGTRYYAEYDLKYTYDSTHKLELDKYSKVKASFGLDFKVVGEEVTSNKIRLKDKSDNIEFNESTGIVSILEGGEAFIEVRSDEQTYISSRYDFNIIKDAVNVYSYNDLMYATNFSSKGEAVVLQKNLESYENTFKFDEEKGIYLNEINKDNTALFGNLKDFNTRTFDFNNELYYFETTYIKDYIEAYNLALGTSATTKVKVALRVQKDLYGNGFTINSHNLSYPNNGEIDSTNGKLTPSKELDYFFGPLALVTIGSIEELSIVKAYAQDNINVLIDSNDVTLNDVKIRNANNIDNMFNLTFTGTSVEVNANNVTIKNSVIGHAKTGIRAFSSDNFTLKNSIVSTCNEFLMKVGSNKHNLVNENQTVNFNYKGESRNTDFKTFFNEKYDAGNGINSDLILTSTIQESSSEDFTSLHSLQSYLDNSKGLINPDGSKNYEATMNVIDSSFYNSGIFSIALESAFNGPYLYNGYPSLLSDQLLPMMNAVAPSLIGRTSYPIKLNILGKTKFYDYKDVDKIDTSGLIEENISLMFPEQSLSIDDFFPMKRILKNKARDLGYLYTSHEINYLNTIVAYYGGGLNLSDVDFDIEEQNYSICDKIEVNVMEEIYKSSDAGFIGMLSKAVSLATGFNSFYFITNSKENEEPALFSKVPTLDDLKLRS